MALSIGLAITTWYSNALSDIITVANWFCTVLLQVIF